jgi:NAD(P)-dependent dehydrogenase (short-subunit alcohol dehydrogenase family)
VNASALPDLSGAVVLVTGGNSGLGLETVRSLTAAGAHVVLTARSQAKAEAAVQEIHATVPAASVESLLLDLADLSSVRTAVDQFAVRHDQLDVLVANAGVMMTPHLTTVDGFELQLGTNHLGHFALIGQLLPLVLATPASRVVTVSSSVHHSGRIVLDDLMFERRRYTPESAYAQSKLANLSFALELQRRLEMVGAETISVAAHPGYSATNLQRTGPGQQEGLRGAIVEVAMRVGDLVAQSAAAGARPQIAAAAAPGVTGGTYLGPSGLGEVRGRGVTRARINPRARDTATAVGLWEASQELTGERYEALVGS